MTLEQIAKKHKTTKWPHGYMPIYEKYFKDLKAVRLLEIGIAEGNSLRMWREYFHVNSTIEGVDKLIQNEFMGGCKLYEGNITDKDVQNMLVGDYDIIIDDGSHIASEQLAAFEGLWPKLKAGGYYCIEDLFTLYDPVWNPVLKEYFDIIDKIHLEMKSILIEGNDIQEVHYYGRNDVNGLLILRKRYEKFRIQPLTEFQNL